MKEYEERHSKNRKVSGYPLRYGCQEQPDCSTSSTHFGHSINLYSPAHPPNPHSESHSALTMSVLEDIAILTYCIPPGW